MNDWRWEYKAAFKEWWLYEGHKLRAYVVQNQLHVARRPFPIIELPPSLTDDEMKAVVLALVRLES